MMNPVSLVGRCLLLDIEGTTSSISFVHDEMFPFVRQHLTTFLAENWDRPELQGCLPLLAADIDENPKTWLSGAPAEDQSRIASAVNQMMDEDRKATGLKQLQGIVWKSGFHSGQLVAHLFDEVAGCLQAWKDAGLDLRIYSSGSVGAQKLFFGHTVAGNLLPLFSAHYDTQVGSKKESASYQEIASDAGLSPEAIIFVSDVPAELSAASSAGLQTVLSLRPGNAPVPEDAKWPSIESFQQLEVKLA